MNIKWIIGFAVLVLTACGSGERAGGASEETNAIAGTILDQDGNAAKGASVTLRSAEYVPQESQLTQGVIVDDSEVQVALAKKSSLDAQSVISTSTDSEGKWELDHPGKGDYVLEVGALDGMKLVEFFTLEQDTADVVMPDMSVDSTGVLRGFVNELEEPGRGLKVYLPGTGYMGHTNEDGYFELNEVPRGKYTLVVKSNDPVQYEDTQIDSVQPLLDENGIADESEYWSQVQNLLDSAGSENEPLNSTEKPMLYVTMKLKDGYALAGYWSFDRLLNLNHQLELENMTANSPNGVIYGEGNLIPGVKGSALHVATLNDYGVLEDEELLKDAQGYSITMWVRVDSLPKDSIVNLFAKAGLNYNNDVFSMTLQQGYCGKDLYTFAFYAAPDSNKMISCASGLHASQPVEEFLGEWVFLAASVKATGEMIFLVNEDVYELTLDSTKMATWTDEAFFFTKENFYGAIDEVKLYNIAYTKAVLNEKRKSDLESNLESEE